MPRIRPLSCARSGCESATRLADLGLHRRPGVERRRLGRCDRRRGSGSRRPPRPPPRSARGSRCAARRAPRAAPTPSTAVWTAISSSAPRSSVLPNDWPTRWIASRRRLRSSWSSSRRRSSWRAISLNCMPSAANSSLPSVGTSTPKSPCAICRAALSSRWICDCRERDTVIANANAAISAATRIASTSSAAPLSPLLLRVGQHAHGDAPAAEARAVEAGQPPACGRRSRPRRARAAGSAPAPWQRRRDHPVGPW